VTPQVRRHTLEQVRGFQVILVAVHRRLRKAGIARHIRLIEQLAGAQRQQRHDPPEVHQRFDLRHLPEVALQVGGNVAFPPSQIILRPCERQQSRHETALQEG
jgi:hypothetical protein